MIQYTSRILAECHPRLGSGDDVINPRRGFDSELNGFSQQLNRAHGIEIPAHVADECYTSVARLREQRVNRITALQSTYPPLHYAILVILAVAECIAFLIETDQELLVFLNAVQLKLLWSMLLGTFVACFAVFIDLRAPFAGSYQISASVDQLQTIKLTLQASRLMSVQRENRQKAEQEATAAEMNNMNANDVNNKESKKTPVIKTSTSSEQHNDWVDNLKKWQEEGKLKTMHADETNDERVLTVAQGRAPRNGTTRTNNTPPKLEQSV